MLFRSANAIEIKFFLNFLLVDGRILIRTNNRSRRPEKYPSYRSSSRNTVCNREKKTYIQHCFAQFSQKYGDPWHTGHTALWICILIFIWCESGCSSGYLFDAEADQDQEPTFHPDADFDPNTDPSFQIKAQTPDKVLKKTHIPYILACHLQVGAYPDPAYHFDPDPDPDFYLMQIRTRIFFWCGWWSKCGSRSPKWCGSWSGCRARSTKLYSCVISSKNCRFARFGWDKALFVVQIYLLYSVEKL